MDIKHRLTFCTGSDTSIIAFLELNKILYEYHSELDQLIVEISESHPKWCDMKQYLDSYGLGEGIVSAVYTEQELESAQWFTCRSRWRWEYPQPKSNSFGYMKNVTYAENSVCTECGCGAKQIGNFRVRKSPVWNGKSFLMLNWENDILFLSDNAKNILCASELSGFGFRDVSNTKGMEKIDNIHQLIVDKFTEPGLLTDNNEQIRETNVCAFCGAIKYALSGRGISYQRSAFPNDADVVYCSEYFGVGHSASRLLFVSHRFRDTVSRNNLDSQLVFEPVTLI